jgi:hypothetical protein
MKHDRIRIYRMAQFASPGLIQTGAIQIQEYWRLRLLEIKNSTQLGASALPSHVQLDLIDISNSFLRNPGQSAVSHTISRMTAVLQVEDTLFEFDYYGQAGGPLDQQLADSDRWTRSRGVALKQCDCGALKDGPHGTHYTWCDSLT